MGRVFANGPGDQGSIPGRVILKTWGGEKKVLDTSLLNTQQYKVRIKGKVEQGKEWCPTRHLDVVAIEKGAFWLPSTTVANFTFTYLFHLKIKPVSYPTLRRKSSKNLCQCT